MLDWIIPKAVAVEIGNTFIPATKGFKNIGFLVNVLLKNVLVVTGIIAFVGVVVAGFNVVRHAGAMEGEKAAQAKSALMTAIIGLVVVAGAYSIIQIVSTILGYDILNPKLPPP